MLDLALSFDLSSLHTLAQAAAEPSSFLGFELSPKFWAYSGFLALVLVFLALDLFVFHRDAHEVAMKEAITWSVIWLTCGIAFAGFVYIAYERHWRNLGLTTPIYNPSPSAANDVIITGTVDGLTAAKQSLTGYIV